MAPRRIPNQPANIPAHWAAAHSHTNRDLRRLLERLRDVRESAADWLNAGHGHDCRCDFCGYQHRAQGDPLLLEEEPRGEQIDSDMRGIFWAADVAIGALESVVLTPPQPKQEQPPQRPKRSPKRVKK
jgi:hypothetical protein